MLWPRAIGLDSCFLGLTFLKEVALAECIIDPFCGVGASRLDAGASNYITLPLFVCVSSYHHTLRSCIDLLTGVFTSSHLIPEYCCRNCVRDGERARNGYHRGELVHCLLSNLSVVGCSR
jgi:hypothetical protein